MTPDAPREETRAVCSICSGAATGLVYASLGLSVAYVVLDSLALGVVTVLTALAAIAFTLIARTHS